VARVGILGGTFNPPHIAHLVCAREALEQLGLDRVVLIPAAVPPHKAVPDDPGADARLEMCELAVAGDPGLAVSDVEVRREGPSYTVATLRALREQAPQDELTLIVGGDMAVAFPSWHEPQEIVRLAALAVVLRSDLDRETVAARLGTVDGAEGRFVFFDMPRLDVSSSLLRGRVAEGRSIRHLVPRAVAERIEARGWYSAPGESLP
jgi:nicotinate-nucleotide adenylyltransferase